MRIGFVALDAFWACAAPAEIASKRALQIVRRVRRFIFMLDTWLTNRTTLSGSCPANHEMNSDRHNLESCCSLELDQEAMTALIRLEQDRVWVQ
jgi:hypothetical protein